MKKPRRILLLEDDRLDADIIRRHIVHEWPECEVVQVNSEATFVAQLQEGRFDVLLCDYVIPGFGGLAAIALARKQVPDLPCLIVSGAINEELALQSLKAGASDYVLKDRLVRLGFAIRRALRDAEEARRHSQMEEQLRQTNQDLTHKNQEIQNFCHTLSHELKTPLTSAREFISIMMDGLAGPLNDTQQEYLAIAKQSCNQMRVCINDLLDATRLETGKLALVLKSISLPALLHQVASAMKPKAAEKRISLRQEIEQTLPNALLDEARIVQVINNLLDNAIKHTPPEGKIVIKAGPSADPGWLQVSISDSGPGISLEEQPRIFERLYQVKAGDAATQDGVGLGLYLCRELVLLHSGKIWVQSEPGRGATFSIALPTAPRRQLSITQQHSNSLRRGVSSHLPASDLTLLHFDAQSETSADANVRTLEPSLAEATN